MGAPSATVDGTFNGITPFTSGASDIDIPQSILLTCFAAFMVYNIAFLFKVDLPTMTNFSTTISCTLIDWLNALHQYIINARALGLQGTLRAIANFALRIFNASHNRVISTYRSSMDSNAFHIGLDRMISKSHDQPNRTILVDTVIVAGAGSLALIRGVPSDLSAPELRRSLESILFIHYASQLRNGIVYQNAVDNTNREGPENTEDAKIDTSTPGLWRGSCVRSRDADDTAEVITAEMSTAETSTTGIATPTSDASGSGVSAVGGASHVLEKSVQDLTSSSRRASHS